MLPFLKSATLLQAKVARALGSESFLPSLLMSPTSPLTLWETESVAHASSVVLLASSPSLSGEGTGDGEGSGVGEGPGVGEGSAVGAADVDKAARPATPSQKISDLPLNCGLFTQYLRVRIVRICTVFLCSGFWCGFS